MKYLILIATLFLSSCFSSKAENGAIVGTMFNNDYRCRYMTRSEYACGVDLYDCVIGGRQVQKIVCATNVWVQ